jgi:hypothetical protein
VAENCDSSSKDIKAKILIAYSEVLLKFIINTSRYHLK